MLKRPTVPPPPPTPPASPASDLSPPGSISSGHQSTSHNYHSPNEALNLFNAGLDNFIQNPPTISQVPRPNPNQNAALVLPPGMSIEQKTEFLSNLDTNNQFFIHMPHMNAGNESQ